MPLRSHEEICLEIRELFAGQTEFVERIGGRGDGEWEWIGENYRSDLRSAVAEQGDFSALCAELKGFPFSQLSYGMVTFSEDEGARRSEELGLIPTGAWKDFFLLKRLMRRGAHLCEAEWSDLFRVNLPGIESSGILVDCFRHAYFASLLLELTRGASSTEIVEIGGGYGGLALQIDRLKLVGHRVRHLIVDLPESLLLAYWFLRMQGQQVSVVFDEKNFERVGPAGVVLVPDYLYGSIPWKADVLFNSRSFSEMSTETSTKYLKQAEEFLAPTSVVLEATGYDLFPDSSRHKERLAEDLMRDLPSYLLDSSNWSPWQGGGGRYFEYVLQRQKGK